MPTTTVGLKDPEARRQYERAHRLIDLERHRASAAERNRRHRLLHPNTERRRLQGRRWRSNNLEKSRALSRAGYKKCYKQGDAFIKNAKDAPCVDCGQKFPSVCMDYDHVRGEKHQGVGEMRAWSLANIQLEIDKCDLVCANCHRIRTFGRLAKTKVSVYE